MNMRPTLRAIARVVCPPDAEDLHLLDDIVEDVERTLAAFPPHLRIALLAGSTVLDLSAAAHPRHLGRRLSTLGRQDADAFFAAWWHTPLTPLAQLPKGLKAVFALAYYEHPTVKQRLAYHPDAWIARVAKKRLERFADAIQREDAKITEPRPVTAAPSPTSRSNPHA